MRILGSEGLSQPGFGGGRKSWSGTQQTTQRKSSAGTLYEVELDFTCQPALCDSPKVLNRLTSGRRKRGGEEERETGSRMKLGTLIYDQKKKKKGGGCFSESYTGPFPALM